MTSLYNNTNYIFSISIKVLYLFIFLSCFFYIIVQKKVTEHLSDTLSDTLYNNYNNIINKNNLNFYIKTSLNDINIHENETIKYNNLIYLLNVCFIIFFLIIPIIIYYICVFIFNKKIPITQIIIYNIILYSLVGIIEYIFFKQIASKYIPVTNGEILSDIKQYFLK